MTTTSTFTMTDRNGQQFGPAISYRPLLVLVGGVKHRLALHRTAGQWIVSDPVSGARITTVAGSYRGIRVSSTDMGPAEARQAAIQQVLALAERAGVERFNERMAAASQAVGRPELLARLSRPISPASSVTF